VKSVRDSPFNEINPFANLVESGFSSAAGYFPRMLAPIIPFIPHNSPNPPIPFPHIQKIAEPYP
jgi:hypothetical protein